MGWKFLILCYKLRVVVVFLFFYLYFFVLQFFCVVMYVIVSRGLYFIVKVFYSVYVYVLRMVKLCDEWRDVKQRFCWLFFMGLQITSFFINELRFQIGRDRDYVVICLLYFNQIAGKGLLYRCKFVGFFFLRMFDIKYKYINIFKSEIFVCQN